MDIGDMHGPATWGVEMGGSGAVTSCGDYSPPDVALPSDASSLSALGLACAFVQSNDLGGLAARRRAQVPSLTDGE